MTDNSLIDDCRRAYLDWCVDNGKLDATLGSAKTSAAWQAWGAAWEERGKIKCPHDAEKYYRGVEMTQSLIALIKKRLDGAAAQWREQRDFSEAKIIEAKVQVWEQALEIVEKHTSAHEAEQTNWEKQYNDILQSSKDFMKNSGKYEEIMENALNQKTDILDKLIYLRRDHAPGYEQWWVMLNLGSASIDGKHSIIIQRFSKKEYAEEFRDAIATIYTNPSVPINSDNETIQTMGDASNRKTEAVATHTDNTATWPTSPTTDTLIQEIRKLREPKNIGLPDGLSSEDTVIFVLNWVENIICKHDAQREIPVTASVIRNIIMEALGDLIIKEPFDKDGQLPTITRIMTALQPYLRYPVREMPKPLIMGDDGIPRPIEREAVDDRERIIKNLSMMALRLCRRLKLRSNNDTDKKLVEAVTGFLVAHNLQGSILRDNEIEGA